MKIFRKILLAGMIFLTIIIIRNLFYSCKREGLTNELPNANAMCKSQYPFIKDNILYGTVARNNPGKSDCGKCWEVEFQNINPKSNVTKAYLQQTNLGYDVNGWGDFLVPGGGFGAFNGCAFMDGWKVYTDQGGPCSQTSDTETCAQYGGFKKQELCNTAFPGDPGAQKACDDILWGVFPDPDGAGYPGNLKVKRYREVTPPSEFFKMSGIGSDDKPSPIGDWINVDGDNATLTHYWDCCKSACSWDNAPNPMMVCDAAGAGPMVPHDDSIKSVCDIDVPGGGGDVPGGGGDVPGGGDDCDCSWTEGGKNCNNDDGSKCWKVCCGSEPAAVPPSDSKSNFVQKPKSIPNPMNRPKPSLDCDNKLHKQCGGKNWKGVTCCPDDSVCTPQNEWYSKCMINQK